MGDDVSHPFGTVFQFVESVLLTVRGRVRDMSPVMRVSLRSHGSSICTICGMLWQVEIESGLISCQGVVRKNF